jgi:hypothetical protein
MASPKKPTLAKLLAPAARLTDDHLRAWLGVQNQEHLKRGWPPIDIDKMMKNPDEVRRLLIRKLWAMTPMFSPADAARKRAAMKELDKPLAVSKPRERRGRRHRSDRGIIIAEMKAFRARNKNASKEATINHIPDWFKTAFPGKPVPARSTVQGYYEETFEGIPPADK